MDSKSASVMRGWQEISLWRRKLRLRTILLSCAASVITQMAVAGPPLENPLAGTGGFDRYSVSSGTITPDGTICADPRATCVNGVSDSGMLQREVTISGVSAAADGTYIQFIITDPGATGDALAAPFSAARDSLNFTNEDWIKMHSRGNSISSKSTIIEGDYNPTTELEDRFVNVSTYNFGPWASAYGAYDPWVTVDQDISQLDYHDYNLNNANPIKEIFDSSASIIENSTPGAYGQNRKVALSQTVDLSTPSSTNDVQGFEFVKASGSLLPNGSGGAGTLLDGLTWSGTFGGELTALWVGQRMDPQKFGYEKYSSTLFGTTTTVDQTSQTSTDPTVWSQLPAYADPGFNLIPLFGATPSLPASMPIVATATYGYNGTSTYANSGTSYAATIAGTGTVPLNAASPVPNLPAYDQWTVSGGVFASVACSGSGVTCSDPIVNESGLYQRIVQINGVNYIQTIVTDETATATTPTQVAALGFRNETYTKMGSTAAGGIAAQLYLADAGTTGYLATSPQTTPLPTDAGQLTYKTQLKTGWANDGSGNDPRVTVDQRILVPEQGVNSSSLDDQFHLEQGLTPVDQLMNITSVVGTQSGGSPPTGGFTNPIMFATSRVGGAFQIATAGSGTTLLDGNGDPNATITNGGTITWSDGDTLQATWIGAAVPTPDPGSAPVQSLTTTSFSNLTAGLRTTSTTIGTTLTPDPDNWFSPFFTPAPAYDVSYSSASPLIPAP